MKRKSTSTEVITSQSPKQPTRAQRKTTDLRYYVSMDLTERKDGVLSEREFIEKGKKLIE